MDNAKALEIFSVQTLCDIGIFLSVGSFLLHLGQPYFQRILGRLTLRVARDLWWLGYLGLRDGALLVALLLGLMHLNLDLMADIKVGLPFVPLGTVALAGAFLAKVWGGPEGRAARWGTALVALGALLNLAGYVLVMEGPGDEYAAAQTGFWHTLEGWKSNANPAMATVVFYVAAGLLAVLAVAAALLALRGGPRQSRPVAAPREEEANEELERVSP